MIDIDASTGRISPKYVAWESGEVFKGYGLWVMGKSTWLIFSICASAM
jgi:hypothetical protein